MENFYFTSLVWLYREHLKKSVGGKGSLKIYGHCGQEKNSSYMKFVKKN